MKFNNNTSMNDLLFHLILLLSALYVLAFIQINPPTKKKNAERQAYYIIVLTWDKDSRSDVDIWVRSPVGNSLYFNRRQIDFMHLDRDDQGTSTDEVRLPNGEVKYIFSNREVVSLKGFIEGWYTVNVHLYRKSPLEIKPIKVKVELIKINPDYRVVTTFTTTMVFEGTEQTAFNFRLDKNANIVKMNKLQYRLFRGRNYGYVQP